MRLRGSVEGQQRTRFFATTATGNNPAQDTIPTVRCVCERLFRMQACVTEQEGLDPTTVTAPVRLRVARRRQGVCCFLESIVCGVRLS